MKKIILLISLLFILVQNKAQAQPKIQYGFVEAHVACYPQDKPEYKVLVISQIFNYCALGTADGVVLLNDQTLIDKAAEKACGVAEYTVTWRDVYHDVNRSRLNNLLAHRENQPGYNLIVNYFSLTEALYSKNCN